MPQTILLLNGDADSREVILTVLRHRGYIALAADAETALERIALLPPELVIMEIPRYVVHGERFFETLRANPRSAGVKVLVLTSRLAAYPDTHDSPHPYDGLLVKPVPVQRLLDEVARLIGPPTPGAELPMALPVPE